MNSLRVTTVNVNGIRAAQRRGGLTWLAEHEPDIVALQEVRADDTTTRAVLASSPLADYHVTHDPCDQPGRAGVAILTRNQPTAVHTGLPGLVNDSGRWLEITTPTAAGLITIVSVYVHAGENGTSKQDDKNAFLNAMDVRLDELAASGRHVLVVGDLNVAHTTLDLKNWRNNRTKSGFLPNEQAHLDTWTRAGWTDLGRAHAGNVPGPYTWWSWRGQAFDNDAGWRIDYLLATRQLASSCTDVTVHKAAVYDERFSDHAPVTATFTW